MNTVAHIIANNYEWLWGTSYLPEVLMFILIFPIAITVLIILVVRRVNLKRKENFEKRNN